MPAAVPSTVSTSRCSPSARTPERQNVAQGLDKCHRVGGVVRQSNGGRVLMLLPLAGGTFKPLASVPVRDRHDGMMRW